MRLRSRFRVRGEHGDASKPFELRASDVPEAAPIELPFLKSFFFFSRRLRRSPVGRVLGSYQEAGTFPPPGSRALDGLHRRAARHSATPPVARWAVRRFDRSRVSVRWHRFANGAFERNSATPAVRLHTLARRASSQRRGRPGLPGHSEEIAKRAFQSGGNSCVRNHSRLPSIAIVPEPAHGVGKPTVVFAFTPLPAAWAAARRSRSGALATGLADIPRRGEARARRRVLSGASDFRN